MSLVAAYGLNGGAGNTPPLSPAYDGVPSGIIWDASGKKVGSACAQFQGLSLITIPYDFGNFPDISISLWTKPVLGTTRTVFSSGPATNFPTYAAAIQNNGIFILYVNGFYLSNTALIPDIWNLVICTWNNTTKAWAIYINNPTIADASGVNNIVPSPAQTEWYFGNGYWGYARVGDEQDASHIDSHELTLEERLQRWNNGNGWEYGAAAPSLAGIWGHESAWGLVA